MIDVRNDPFCPRDATEAEYEHWNRLAEQMLFAAIDPGEPAFQTIKYSAHEPTEARSHIPPYW